MKTLFHLQTITTLILLLASAIHAAYVESWSNGTYQLTAPGNICSLDFGVTMHLNSDGNVAIFRQPDPATLVWSSGKTSPNCANGACTLYFQTDGNLVVYGPGNVPLWYTGTAGRGTQMACLNVYPYLEIFDAQGTLIWYPHDIGISMATEPECVNLTAPWLCVV